jgi:hypothetical protein
MTSGGNLGGTWGADSGAGMEVASGESPCRKMSKLLVRRGEEEKGQYAS